ncbi:hypothetical protein RIF29_07347 [Crotalaria pallida]|uniref:BHLH domain-containing protein n=1 Tax=Crotalaria pallida TaxID=3830 RepID=A0AAN9PC14_CROPI
MENFGEEYKHYWETNMFLQTQEFHSWGLSEALSGYYDSSSPDGGASSSVASKNIVSERNRRKKLNDRLFALRAVVPNISKMDKASIVKDAIEYIEHLHEQEKSIQGEITELEASKQKHHPTYDNFQKELPVLLRSKKKRTEHLFADVSSRNFPIQVIELKIISANITSFSATLLKTALIEAEEDKDSLQIKIHNAIAARNEPQSPGSI